MQKIPSVLIFAIGLFISGQIKAQNSEWLRGTYHAPSGASLVKAITTDKFGNVFTAGVGYGPGCASMSFGTDTLTNTDTISHVVIVKYDSLGNVLWARNALQDLYAYPTAMSTDPSGNLYVSGIFDSTIIFGTDTLFNTETRNHYFLVKYDTSGNVVWSKTGEGTCLNNSVSVSNGYVYLSGSYYIPFITFNSNSDTLLDNNDSGKTFIAQFDTSGNFIWAKNSGIGECEAFTSASDVYGNIYVAGNAFSSSISFDGSVLTESQSNLLPYLFLVKYSPIGTIQWLRGSSMVGPGPYNQNNAITTDLYGNIYMTGLFTVDTVNFGGHTINNHGAMGTSDMFVTKYDSSGNVKWAISAGGTQDDPGYSISCDVGGDVWVSGGFFSSQVTLETHADVFPVGGTDPALIFELDSTGNFVQSIVLKTGGASWNGMAVSPLGGIYINGNTEINPLVIANDTISCPGDANMFLARNPYDTATVATDTTIDTALVIPNINSNELVSLYPNPAGDAVTVSYTGNIDKNATVQLYNITGALILSIPATGNNTYISTSAFAPGVYFCKMTVNRTTITKKLIVER